MKRGCTAVLVAMVALTACSTATSPPSTFGVDGAPELIKDAFITVTRQAATLVGYDATNDQWLEFARAVCASDLENAEELADFVAERAGAGADAATRQMWSTAATAATSSFCPIGQT